MSIDKFVVIISGIFGIIFVAWFFFGKKEEEIEAGEEIDIAVKGGYAPSTVVLKKGKTTKITFTRTDSNNCLEEIVLPDFKVRKYLPINQKISVSLTPKKEGQYEISCGMNMFHGKIIVK